MIRAGTLLGLAVGAAILCANASAEPLNCEGESDKSKWSATDWTICAEKKKVEAKKQGYKSIDIPPPSRPYTGSGPGTGGLKALKNLKEFESQIQLEKLDKLK